MAEMIDPRADGDITVVGTHSGFLIGPTRRPGGAPAVTQYMRLVSDLGEAKRVAQALAQRYGGRAWISREDRFTVFVDVRTPGEPEANSSPLEASTNA